MIIGEEERVCAKVLQLVQQLLVFCWRLEREGVADLAQLGGP